MKKDKHYNLEEAIKNFYKSEPLKIDLANTVANKVFAKPKEVSVVSDKWLYIFVAILIVCGLIYIFSFLKEFSQPYVLLIFIPLIGYFGLSLRSFP